MRPLLRLLARLGWMVLGAVSAVLVVYVLSARSMPDLEPWHLARFTEDVAAELEDVEGASLASYLAREDRIFERLEEGVRRLGPRGERALWSRYNPEGRANPLRFEVDWNRTQERSVDAPRGGAVLVHGLSDSPYSMRALAEQLHAMGFHVLALRMPGHGTVPGALRRATWHDWRAAVHLGVAHVAERIPAGAPLVLAGYSNGAALVVDHTLRALAGDATGRPTRLILISPALRAPAVAGFAYLQRWLSMLPGLEKLAWADVLPEFDPYKYNSFPVYAGEQIHDLTVDVQQRLSVLAAAGGLEAFPPVLAFQSVVDATIPPAAVIDGLLDRLSGNGSQLVLFDVNREARIEDLLDQRHEALLAGLRERAALPFDYTLVTNADEHTHEVVALTRRAGQRDVETEPLALAWPEDVYSLSHVALPFPPGDPIYGARESDDPDVLALGDISWRGERGVFGVPMDLLKRLRWNPFFPYLEARVQRALYPDTP